MRAIHLVYIRASDLTHHTTPLSKNTLAGACRRWLVRVLICTVVYAVQVPVYAREVVAWPDTFLNRLQLLALIQTLNAELLASRSATFILERWCETHRLAAIPRISARLVQGLSKEPTIGATPAAPGHRSGSGKLSTRGTSLRQPALSAADNWYVPSRLTAEMDGLLGSTDTPFGKAIESLEPYRRTMGVNQLWTPLPEGWEGENVNLPAATSGTLAIPDACLSIARLSTRAITNQFLK